MQKLQLVQLRLYSFGRIMHLCVVRSPARGHMKLNTSERVNRPGWFLCYIWVDLHQLLQWLRKLQFS